MSRIRFDPGACNGRAAAEALATARRADRRAASLSGALLSAESASSEEELVNLRAERTGESRERYIRLSLSVSLSFSRSAIAR